MGHETRLDGTEYFGEYVNGSKEGVGIQIWKAGNKYTGEWQEGQQHGFGVFQWKDGREYYG